MKILIALLALAALARGQIVDMSAGEVDVAYAKRYLEQVKALDRMRSKMEDVCPEQSSRLEESLLMAQECINEIPDESETLCSMVKNHFIRCSKPMTKLISDCMPEAAKELPDVIIESVVSVSNYTCRSDGEHIFEFTNPCVMKRNSRLARCERKIKTKIQQFSRTIPTKQGFCQFLQDMKPCLQSHVNYACGNAITKESFLGLFDALLAPCNDLQKEIFADNEIAVEVETL